MVLSVILGQGQIRWSPLYLALLLLYIVKMNISMRMFVSRFVSIKQFTGGELFKLQVFVVLFFFLLV